MFSRDFLCLHGMYFLSSHFNVQPMLQIKNLLIAGAIEINFVIWDDIL